MDAILTHVKLAGLAIAIGAVFATGFLLGRINPPAEDKFEVEKIAENVTVPDFISITRCDTQDVQHACFGSGREVFMQTERATIFNLISKEGTLQYGVTEKETGEQYELIIR